MIFNMSGSIEASGGGNDFIVTLSYDSSNNFWVPDRTWAEMEAANQAGKNIITCVDDNDYYFVDYQVSGTFDGVSYNYCVAEYFYDDDSGVSGVKAYYTELYSNDEPLADPPNVSYYTDSADAVASDVANGKVFYNANGRQTGTASSGEVLWANWNGDVAAYNSSGTPQATDLSITVPVAGTYKVKSIVRNTYPYSYGTGSHVRYYKNNTAVGTQHTVAAATFSAIEETITCAAGDVITLYCCSANSTYTTACSGLFVCPA